MAVYKVAQDVEADDKLLGPFSARQFIYLIIVALAGMLAWFLSRVFLPLMVIPMPVILFFGALALPLRKDQPMEVYLAAMVSFYLKPRKRFWVPDGLESLVEIIAPKVSEDVRRTKDFNQVEAEQRLSYLADIVDTEGWAIRHAAGQPANTSMIGDVYNAAQAAEDLLDDTGSIAQGFETMIAEADERHRQQILERMHAPAPQPAVATAPLAPVTQTPVFTAAPLPAPTQALAPAPVAQPAQDQSMADIHFNPYPTIHQSVIQPLNTDDQTAPVAQPTVTDGGAADTAAKSTSETVVSPDIMNLVSNSDLSIETIAREAHRIQDKDEGEEVVISLR